MLTIAGDQGEGGGQIVRVATALAAATQTSVRITDVRAKRPTPGLRPQHAAALRALADVADARLTGGEVGSTDVTFEPGVTVGGTLEVTIDTAGSVTLVLQALLPALCASRQAFTLRLAGGTDVPFAPSWAHFAQVQARLLALFGVDVEATLERRGYFPAGGGRVTVNVDAGGFTAATFPPPERAPRAAAVVHAHGLPKHVLHRGVDALRDAATQAGLVLADVATDHHRGPGTGFGVAAWTLGACPLGADALGRRGVPAERVVANVARTLAADVKAGVQVDEHQADMLPPLLALTGGGSFTTRVLTPHTQTVLGLLPAFLPVTTATEPGDGRVRVTVATTGTPK